MNEDEIFEVVRKELRYQEKQTFYENGYVRGGLSEGEVLLAIDKLVNDAKNVWYLDSPPHLAARHLIRKIAALSIRMCMDKIGMPERF